jgi:hypothetical protein
MYPLVDPRSSPSPGYGPGRSGVAAVFFGLFALFFVNALICTRPTTRPDRSVRAAIGSPKGWPLPNEDTAVAEIAVAVALLGSAGIGRQQPGLAERGPGPLGATLPRDQVIVGRGQRTQ